MDKIITLLQNLLSLNKLASVSLPGLFSAFGLAILLWPPKPIDEIPCVVLQSRTQQQTSSQVCSVRATAGRNTACNLGTLELPEGPWFNRESAQHAQYVLDQEKQNVAECIEEETSKKGREKSENDYLAQDILNLQKLVTAELDTYSNYEKTNNALAAQARAKWEVHQREIESVRQSILKNEQSIRDRDENLAELSRFDKIISDRLADPQRLRPRKTFDDVLIALVSHVTGFILLAIVLGVVITPIAQAGSAGYFDWIFREGY